MRTKNKFHLPFIIIFISLTLLNLISFTVHADEEKIIYLTFDDGPCGKNTNDVLDILKAEKVPATFFLIGEQIDNQQDIINRMHKEGHSMGLHSMTHNKARLYSSNSLFLQEMLDTQKKIKEVTGVETHILRFPFGCNNSIYKLKEPLVNILHENNLRIYNWNVDSTDGSNPYANPDWFIKRAISDSSPIILLMHCGPFNKNSVIALPQIIRYYKSKGYEFKKIDDSTPELFNYLNR